MESSNPPPVPDRSADPDERPALAGELRSLRRWLIVTAVWAVAASAIGIIALLAANNSDEETARTVSRELTRVQRDVNVRLDTLEQDINELARREDVTRLEQRIGRAEDSASRAAKDAKSASDGIDGIETRVEDLEADADAGAGDDTGGSGDSGGESP